jgi:hypothetical protein
MNSSILVVQLPVWLVMQGPKWIVARIDAAAGNLPEFVCRPVF